MKDSQITDEIIDEAEEIDPQGSAAGDVVDGAEDSDAGTDDDRIGELERELTLERDKYLRLAAEFDNFRKRMTRESIEA